MYNSAGLIPTRFLILISHFIICVILLWSQKNHSHLCYQVKGMENHPKYYAGKQTEFVLGISVAVGMICLEMLAFLLGMTMFNTTSALLSVTCHSSASILLSFFIFDGWQCGWFWWIFGIGCLPPILYDTYIVFKVLYRRKY